MCCACGGGALMSPSPPPSPLPPAPVAGYRWWPPPSPSPTPTCHDLDLAGTLLDVDGDNCAFYTANPSYCTDSWLYDDYLSASAMCCACGGGALMSPSPPLSPSPPPCLLGSPCSQASDCCQPDGYEPVTCSGSSGRRLQQTSRGIGRQLGHCRSLGYACGASWNLDSTSQCCPGSGDCLVAEWSTTYHYCRVPPPPPPPPPPSTPPLPPWWRAGFKDERRLSGAPVPSSPESRRKMEVEWLSVQPEVVAAPGIDDSDGVGYEIQSWGSSEVSFLSYGSVHYRNLAQAVSLPFESVPSPSPSPPSVCVAIRIESPSPPSPPSTSRVYQEYAGRYCFWDGITVTEMHDLSPEKNPYDVEGCKQLCDNDARTGGRDYPIYRAGRPWQDSGGTDSWTWEGDVITVTLVKCNSFTSSGTSCWLRHMTDPDTFDAEDCEERSGRTFYQIPPTSGRRLHAPLE